jgi:hypothetical protein
MVLRVIRVTVLITPLISSTFLVGHCIAWYLIYNDQQEKFEDIKGVIRTVNHMTGNTMTNKKSSVM